MGTDENPTRVKRRTKVGRPRHMQEHARSNRVVTFVTDRELQSLEQIADKEDRSLSAVIYRILTQHLNNTGTSENAE